jgi:hypothetical protein
MKSREICIHLEFSLVTRVFSCGGDVGDDHSYFSLLALHLYFSLSLSLGVARVSWSSWSILEHLGSLGLGFIPWRFEIRVL